MCVFQANQARSGGIRSFVVDGMDTNVLIALQERQQGISEIKNLVRLPRNVFGFR